MCTYIIYLSIDQDQKKYIRTCKTYLVRKQISFDLFETDVANQIRVKIT